MSIKISCDQEKSTSLFSISLSPRRDVAKKRLKLKKHLNKLTTTTTITSIMITATATTTSLSSLLSSSSSSSSSAAAAATTTTIKSTSSQLYKINNNIKNSINLKSIKIKNQLTKITDNSKFNNLNNNNYNIIVYFLFYIILLLLFNTIHFVRPTNALLIVEPTSLSDGILLVSNSEQEIFNTGSKSTNNNNNLRNNNNNGNNNIELIGNGGTSSTNSNNNNGHYLDKLDNLERSLAAVLIKVAYGTTSTTKRSIPDNSYVPSLTTIATPPLTTLRYSEKSPHQQQINLHHRNYELDLERDHALPTSAPNADILKSNSNPTYPNPNRHHNHDRDRHRHTLNSTPAPSIHNLLKKGQPTIPMYPGDIPSYSPPARAFFTPPLPPEYQNPFADKPTLRGTNNDGGIINNPGSVNGGTNGGSITGNGGVNGNGNPSYINRRPIPPPSLMPGHERIPYRPPELGNQNIGTGSEIIGSRGVTVGNGVSIGNSPAGPGGNYSGQQQQRKKALNTPSQKTTNKIDHYNGGIINNNNSSTNDSDNNDLNNMKTTGRVHIPNISRILSGSNGKKEDIPDVLLQQVTNRPDLIGYNNNNKYTNINQNKFIENSKSLSTINNHDIIIDDILKQQSSEEDNNNDDNFDDIYIQKNQNHNQDEPKTQLTIKMSIKSTENPLNINKIYSTQIVHNLSSDKNFVTSSSSSGGTLSTSNIGNIISGHETIATAAASLPNNNNNKDIINKNNNGKNIIDNSGTSISSSTISSTTLTTTWDIAWNIHIYLSVILFTILGVYSIFKIIFYNKLTHLFNQSYFICINIILISICIIRIFYLIYDAYNINSTFNILISELLLNIPSIFLTITFSILILFLLIRSLNHKNNRYSSLIRPLTVVVGSSVHVGLCITLHYVENYTTNNLYNHYYQQQQHQQQFIQLQQQQQQLLHQHQQQQLLNNPNQQQQQQILYRTINDINNNNNDGIISTSINNNNHNNNNNLIINNIGRSSLPIQTQPPPRVLSLICQIIYIFVCLSLGLLYLYIYRLLKRVLRNKSQNYIHGYQNLSYAIHITIATSLLFILLASLQIFGAISIPTIHTLNINGILEIDWLQWGYQFSLRLIEISIIWLIGWVAGLKTGGSNNNSNIIGNGGNSLTNNINNTNNILQRDKSNCSGNDNRNISGFALFPCTSSSSQENFETDYPAICNANTNLHTYTKRTGKPIYDDNFTLNSIQNNNHCNTNIQSNGQQQRILSSNNDFHQLQNNTDYVRTYDTNSLRSDHHHRHHHPNQQQHHHHQQQHQHHHNSQLDNEFIGDDDDNDDNINGAGIIIDNGKVDHYENPNFELRCSKLNYHYQQQQEQNQIDNCYSEPLNPHGSNNSNSSSTTVRNNQNYDQGYDFQNFERPQFQDRSNSRSSGGNGGNNNNSIDIEYHYNNNHHHNNTTTINKIKHTTKLDRTNYENAERRSSNSTHSCTSGRIASNNINNGINSIDGLRYPIYNSFERRSNGVRKSGTLNNIGGIVHGRNGSSSSSSSVSNQQHNQHHHHHRPSGVQTLSSGHRNSGPSAINSSSIRNGILNNQNGIVGSNSSSSSKGGSSNGFYRNGNSTIAFQQQHMLPSDDEMILIANNSASERTNLLNNHCNSDGTATATTTPTTSAIITNCGDGGGITSSISGGNLTDIKTIPNSGGGGNGIGSVVSGGGSASSSGESANSGSMLVAEHGFVRFRALDDINNAQGVGIHNASIRTTGRNKEKRYTNNT